MTRGLLLLLLIFLSCRQENDSKNEGGSAEPGQILQLQYARGFSARQIEPGLIELTVHDPWPGAERPYRYALLSEKYSSEDLGDQGSYDAIVPIPVNRMVLTSTTHIPALETLGSEQALSGFPGLHYISSERTRKRIDAGQVAELGANDQLNTERVLELRPDLVVGFGVAEAPRSYQGISAAGIPVIYNGDWTETSPLAKAEWIKFFGLLLGKEAAAIKAFEQVASEYNRAKELAADVPYQPVTLSGALYRDVWYAPGGGSWAAGFIRDAGARYLWSDTEARGSLSLALETVLERAGSSEVWVSPSQYTSFSDMRDANPLYERIPAFRQGRVYTYAKSKGPTGGLLYFELGPSRPDLVLKDLIYYIHPGLLPDYEPVFFQPLDP